MLLGGVFSNDVHGVSLSDLANFRPTGSVAQPLYDSWAPCFCANRCDPSKFFQCI